MTKGEIDRRFDEIVDFSGVEKFLDTPVKRYSSGMYVRLAFSVAAHLEPEVLIVDEVLAVGDVMFQRKCLGKMNEAAGSGRTVIFVSHQIAAVKTLCSRAILMQSGKVAMDGPVDEVATAYSRAYMPADAKAVFRPPTGSATGTPQIREARILADGVPTAQPQMGQELSIEVDFDSDRPVAANLGVVINNAEGAKVLHTSSRYAPMMALKQPRRAGTIRYDYGRVPLTAGDYSISLYLGDEQQETHSLIEAMRFEMFEHDVFDAGRAYPSDHSQLYWPVETSVSDPLSSEAVASRPAEAA